MRVAFYTIGCKLNQFETEFMREQFEDEGWEVVPFREEADVYIINTCTVTSQADAKSRQSIRQAKKRNPDAVVVAVGCYPQVAAEEVVECGADVVLGNREKLNVLGFVKEHIEKGTPVVRVSELDTTFSPMPVRDFSSHSRAFVKVQDGCNRRCSYCIVWRARGPSRSAPPSLVLDEAKRLVDAGFEEIVLTGTHLGAYGRDRGTSLVELLEKLLCVDGLKKIRLSSLEPTEITSPLIELMASTGKIARHLHIPLQSASNRILKLMNRPYTAEQFEELVMEIAERLPGVGIGVDVIVGFPTETDEDFEKTYSLIERLPIYYMHIFSYSPRPQTPAASLKPQVRPDIKKKRWERLNLLKAQKKRAFVASFVGKVLDATVEGRPAPEAGYWSAVSENYIPLLVPQNMGHMKKRVLAFRVEEARGDKAVAVPASNTPEASPR